MLDKIKIRYYWKAAAFRAAAKNQPVEPANMDQSNKSTW